MRRLFIIQSPARPQREVHRQSFLQGSTIIITNNIIPIPIPIKKTIMRASPVAIIVGIMTGTDLDVHQGHNSSISNAETVLGDAVIQLVVQTLRTRGTYVNQVGSTPCSHGKMGLPSYESR
jgi:hypothetical protein